MTTTTTTTTATILYKFTASLFDTYIKSGIASDMGVFLFPNGLEVVVPSIENGGAVYKNGDEQWDNHWFVLTGEMYTAIKGTKEPKRVGGFIVWHNVTEFLDLLNPLVRIESIDEILADLV